MSSGLPVDQNPYRIAYFIATDIQHFPPVLRLYPLLGGIVITIRKEIHDFINTKYQSLNIPCVCLNTKEDAQAFVVNNGIRTVIYPGYNILYRGNAIQIFHGGLSDKNFVESLGILMYDLVLFPGEKTKDKVEKAGYLKSIPLWKLVGYPKFDPLINKTLTVNPVFKNNRKTILYAPTWVSQNQHFEIVKFSDFGESSLELWTLEIVKALHRDYNLIIKYHSRIYRKPGDIYDQVDSLITELGAQSHVVTKIDDNILPYMVEADLMISDISTACYEWFHFNKPIVYANPAPEHYKPSSDIGSNTYAWQAGDVLYSADQIQPVIKANLQHDQYRGIRNEIFNYTVYKPDGKATERQAQAIIDFCQSTQNVSYRWLVFKTMMWRRMRRTKVKILNTYYHLFKKEKIGK